MHEVKLVTFYKEVERERAIGGKPLFQMKGKSWEEDPPASPQIIRTSKSMERLEGCRPRF